ncbi:DUF2529 domain-containing protein [Bacillus sp. FJAT-50079]|uniref:DUF2529 domain-containing protein n=1 Tax=Bacillus sp. FJAT-50079 TaxID=2833577 RepID=UPI001BC99589|nr:DUF2529 domain-containing protein [Bacillus sp. FJAT-50079]MBS4206815.1 DUF2529 domain-containing protein [Bacillus sp. FJAT-50079]
MLKMFSTQLTGLFQRIMEKESFQFEDGARLLAQAPVGEGLIYIKGFQEMGAVIKEAIEGAEPLKSARTLESSSSLSSADRVIIFTRFADDEEAVALGNKLEAEGVPFVAVAGKRTESGQPTLEQLADVFIHTNVTRPLLPTEDGTRVGFPSSIAALYIYFGLKFMIEEMVAEYE